MLGTPFFGGDSPNMTDYMIWPWIERLPMFNLMYGDEKYEVPRTSLENYHGWVEKMMQDPAVKQYALSAEEYCKFRQQLDKNQNLNYDFLL